MLRSLRLLSVQVKPFRLFSMSGVAVTAMRGRGIFAYVTYASTTRHGHKGRPYNGRRWDKYMSVSAPEVRRFQDNPPDGILWGNPTCRTANAPGESRPSAFEVSVSKS